MAGYLGTKAVLLSTTAADVIGNAEIGGDLTVGGNITSTGIDDNASSTAITIDGSQNVGIGTSSPSEKLQVDGNIFADASFYGSVNRGVSNPAGTVELRIRADNSAGFITAHTNGSERMRIDSSGNLLVGKSSADNTTAGTTIYSTNGFSSVRNSNTVAILNRLTSDGDIAVFRKDGITVASIGTWGGGFYVGSPSAADAYLYFGNAYVAPSTTSGFRDNAIDLGNGSARFDDIYATNGTIQTSDRNEKQDIEALNDAETRVAQACKGLLRKFRWKDAVAEKGDDARIHFGIIAQDLQDAFAAEGLDAGRYAMFISSTWWETQTDVPAVEAVAEVLDEDGNVVTEAVEAKEAYTRTDTYETQEEAPEGATERTRLGVRYPELLAFIIGAM